MACSSDPKGVWPYICFVMESHKIASESFLRYLGENVALIISISLTYDRVYNLQIKVSEMILLHHQWAFDFKLRCGFVGYVADC